MKLPTISPNAGEETVGPLVRPEPPIASRAGTAGGMWSSRGSQFFQFAESGCAVLCGCSQAARECLVDDCEGVRGQVLGDFDTVVFDDLTGEGSRGFHLATAAGDLE